MSDLTITGISDYSSYISYQGDFDISCQYYENDLIKFDSSNGTYICIQDSLYHYPSDDKYWKMLSNSSYNYMVYGGEWDISTVYTINEMVLYTPSMGCFVSLRSDFSGIVPPSNSDYWGCLSWSELYNIWENSGNDAAGAVANSMFGTEVGSAITAALVGGAAGTAAGLFASALSSTPNAVEADETNPDGDDTSLDDAIERLRKKTQNLRYDETYSTDSTTRYYTYHEGSFYVLDRYYLSELFSIQCNTDTKYMISYCDEYKFKSYDFSYTTLFSSDIMKMNSSQITMYVPLQLNDNSVSIENNTGTDTTVINSDGISVSDLLYSCNLTSSGVKSLTSDLAVDTGYTITIGATSQKIIIGNNNCETIINGLFTTINQTPIKSTYTAQKYSPFS